MKYKVIPGFPDYIVTDLGRVFRHARKGRTIAMFELSHELVTKWKYHRVYLEDPTGKNVKVYVHSAVLEAWVGPRPKGMHACHNNGKPEQNFLQNLRWDTPKGNVADIPKHRALRAIKRELVGIPA